MSLISKFIDKIPADKKSHLILGLIVNPFAFIAFYRLPFYGFLTCLSIHAFIEIYQWVTKTGKFEVLDFLAGSYSAICIYALIELIN